MLDIGWSELLVIGVVALIVVGPKDLPMMFRTLGRFTAKMRSMGREFQRAMDEAAKQSGMDETVRDLKSMTSKKSLGLDALESAAAKFEKWDPTKPSVKPAVPQPASATAAPAAMTAATAAAGPGTKALAEKLAAERAGRVARTTEAIHAAQAAKAAGPAKVPKAGPGMRRSAQPKAVAPSAKSAAKAAPKPKKPAAAKAQQVAAPSEAPARPKTPRAKKSDA
jgi:sec-independent protein translocase protein TatB